MRRVATPDKPIRSGRVPEPFRRQALWGGEGRCYRSCRGRFRAVVKRDASSLDSSVILAIDPMNKILTRAPSLADTVAGSLRREISEARYKAGEKLPTERELSESYGVSRAIIREALGLLKQDGLVRSRQGSGAFVEEGGTPVFRLAAVDLRDTIEIQNVVELLVAFESAASALAATRRSKAQLAAITAQFNAMEVAIEEDRSGVDEDVAFHRAIVEATANPVFRDMFDFLDTRVRGFIGAARTNSARRSLSRQVQDEHKAILDAIKAKDAEAARSSAATHLQNAIKRLTSQRISDQ